MLAVRRRADFCCSAGFRVIGWDREAGALAVVVDVRRDPILPLLAAHVAGELGAERVGPVFEDGPQAQGRVVTAGDQAPAVGAEGDARYTVGMALQGLADRGAGGGVPQAQGGVPTG